MTKQLKNDSIVFKNSFGNDRQRQANVYTPVEIGIFFGKRDIKQDFFIEVKTRGFRDEVDREL